MNKVVNPVVKEGLGIAARLVVIVLLLGLLGSLLQGCTGQREMECLYMEYQPIPETETAKFDGI